MARTNIDLDDRLVAEVMQRYDLASKKDAVNFALRRLAGPVMTRDQMLAMEGSGWDGDLAELRTAPVRTV